MDRVRQLGFQEFLNLLSRVLENIKTMLSRVKVNHCSSFIESKIF